MKVVLLITLVESAIVALLMILWRYRSVKSIAPVPVRQITRAEANHIASSDPNDARRTRWAFINGWKVEPQFDDRMPAFGSVASSTASAPGRRSTARRRHQAMYKRWSQDRHD